VEVKKTNEIDAGASQWDKKKYIKAGLPCPFQDVKSDSYVEKKMSWYSCRKCNVFFRIRNTCARACATRLAGKSTSDMLCLCGGVIILASEKPVVPGTRSEKEIQLHRPSPLIRGSRYQHHVYFSPNNRITAAVLITCQL